MDRISLGDFGRLLFERNLGNIGRRTADNDIEAHLFVVVAGVLALIHILFQRRAVQLEFIDSRKSARRTRHIIGILAFVCTVQVHDIVIVRKATLGILGQVDNSWQNENRRLHGFGAAPAVRFIVLVFGLHRYL